VNNGTMPTQRNLTASQWADVLLNEAELDAVASALKKGRWLPWTTTLLRFTEDSQTVLDLGSGRGENSGSLALAGKKTTLLEWAPENLAFSRRLFNEIGVDGQFCRADMTQPLPFHDGSFDTVFSCGVFEYFDAGTIDTILKEAFRVSRKRVIIMVPNALSVPYRIGKWYLEKTGKWYWGGEVPSYTLKPHFRRLGPMRIVEFSVGARHAFDFLKMPAGKAIKELCVRLLRLRDHARPACFRQGYLLVTVGEKVPGERP
jgi:ubiquinone/menaquinone biosynthesis C-methylase UbiE